MRPHSPGGWCLLAHSMPPPVGSPHRYRSASGRGCDTRPKYHTIAHQPHRPRIDRRIQEGVGMTTYTLISSDSHIIEPADLWEQRMDRRFQDRGPRLVHEGEFDQWYADGVKFGNIGINQQAGLRFEAPEKLTTGGSMATIPLGGVDPHAHVQDMDVDSVAGGVLYPSQGLTLYRVPDSQ